MKKIFALAIALSTITVVFAQGGYDRRSSRDVVLGQPNRGVYNNGYGIRERDEQIQRIRREYNWKIESVEHSRYLRKAEKRRQIRFLENERNAKIREVMIRYDRYNDRNHRRGRY